MKNNQKESTRCTGLPHRQPTKLPTQRDGLPPPPITMGEAEGNGVNSLAYPAEDFERFTIKEKRPNPIPAPASNPIIPTPQATMDSFRDVTAEFFEASESMPILFCDRNARANSFEL